MDRNRNTWWNRLAKVLFWIVSVLTLFSTVSVIWGESEPTSLEVVDDAASYIQCNKDVGTRDVYYFNKNLLSADYVDESKLSDYSKTRAKEICGNLTTDQKLLYSREETRLIENGVWNYDERQALLEKYKARLVGDDGYTYEIQTKTLTHSSWTELITYEGIAIFGVLLMMYLIASTYNYVIFGEKFRSPLALLRSRKDRVNSHE